MSKSFEQLPNFGSRIELITFLRLLADDIENGATFVKSGRFSKYWEITEKGLYIHIETVEDIR